MSGIVSELSFTLYGVSDTNQHDGNCWPRACFLSRFVQTALSVIACLNPKQNHMLLRMFFLFKFQIWCESIQVLFLQPCCWPMAEGLASLGEPAPQGQAQGFAATLGARDCSCLSVSDMIPVGVLSALTASPFPVWPLALGFSGRTMLSSFEWSPGCRLQVFWTLAAELCCDRKKHNYSPRLKGNCEHLHAAFLFNTCLECLSQEGWKGISGCRRNCTASTGLAWRMGCFLPILGKDESSFLDANVRLGS